MAVVAFTINTVDFPALTINNGAAAAGTTGQPFTLTLTASNPVLSWSIVGVSNFTIDGNQLTMVDTSTAGAFAVTVKATDIYGRNVSKTITVTLTGTAGLVKTTGVSLASATPYFLTMNYNTQGTATAYQVVIDEDYGRVLTLAADKRIGVSRPGNTYSVRVRAINATEQGAWSDPVNCLAPDLTDPGPAPVRQAIRARDVTDAHVVNLGFNYADKAVHAYPYYGNATGTLVNGTFQAGGWVKDILEPLILAGLKFYRTLPAGHQSATHQGSVLARNLFSTYGLKMMATLNYYTFDSTPVSTVLQNIRNPNKGNFAHVLKHVAGLNEPNAPSKANVKISAISKANPGVVTTLSAHGYATGDVRKLYVPNGMTQLNGVNVTITKLTNTTFSIGINTTAYGTYTSGGEVLEDYPGGTDWRQEVIAHHLAIDTELQNSAYAGVEHLCFSPWGRRGYDALATYTDPIGRKWQTHVAFKITKLNYHYYTGGRRPEICGAPTGADEGGTPLSEVSLDWTVSDYNANLPPTGQTLPGDITESGWGRLNGDTNTPYVSANAGRKFSQRLTFEALRRGIKYTVLFQLFQTDFTNDWQMVDFSIAGGTCTFTKLPLYDTFLNTLAAFTDNGANAYTFSPGTLNFSLGDASGSPGSYTQNIHHLLIQKSDGKFYLAIWYERDSWNRNTKADDFGSKNVKLTLPAAMAVATNRPYTNQTFASQGTLSSIDLTVNDDVLVVRIG
jgi:hypothetical protein